MVGSYAAIIALVGVRVNEGDGCSNSNYLLGMGSIILVFSEINASR